jgi:hypothetical protein
VKDNGAKSSAAEAARKALITDLENAGLSAQAAGGLVAGLTTNLQDLQKGSPYAVNLKETGVGVYSITGSGTSGAEASAAGGRHIIAGAKGRLITGGTGPTADDVLALVSKGETIVSAADSHRLAPLFKKLGIPGYASGGVPGYSGGIGGLAGATATDWSDFQSAMTGAMESSMTSSFKTAVAAATAAAAAASLGTAGGSATPGLLTVARYVMSHGGNAFAGAGVAGVVAGESSGDPEVHESGGGGGEGLLQWTPPTVPWPYPNIITGNAGKDMATQLVDMMGYISQRGGIGRLNAAGSPMGAAEAFSAMEAPLVPGSDIRSGVVASIYAMLAGGNTAPAVAPAGGSGGRRVFDQGGLITEPVIGWGQQSGQQYMIGGNGPEWVTPAGGQAGGGSKLAENLSIMMPEGSTLAAAFTELNFRLKVAQQQGWAGELVHG